ncbi:MAG: efflux RND transporter permease subunit [Cyanobacteria bacterium J06639_1]
MWNLFYRNTQLLLLTLCLIAVWGLGAFFTLPRLEDPELVQRNAVITTLLPGASAERVETLVTDRIEEELFDVEEIDHVESVSRPSFSTVQVELSDTATGVDEIWSRVRDKLDDAIPLLPDGALEPEFEISEVKANALITSLTWQLDTPPNYAILGRWADQLEDALRVIPGTESVDVVGAPAEEIVVEADAAALTTLGLTVTDLSQQIASSDAKVTAGQLRSPQSDLLFEVTDELDSLDRIRNIPIRSGGTNNGQFSRLADVARVDKGIVDPASALASVSGRPAVVVSAIVQSSERLDVWAARAETVLAEFGDRLPAGIELTTLFEQSPYVAARLDTVLSNLAISAVLVVGIAVFLMGWQSALVVGSALPLATLMVFGGMSILGVPIHQMSVTGIIIALGLLIDNAIVIVDEVSHEREDGFTAGEAIARSTRHVAVPLLASTLTTVLAFMPIALAPGGTGEFTGTIAVSVILAVFSSLFLALTVIPALAGRMYRLPGRSRVPRVLRDGFSHPRLTSWYRRFLRGLFSRPVLGVLLALVLPAIGFMRAGTLAQQFFPPTDRNQFYINFELPVQASLTETQSEVAKARDLILQQPAVTDVHWFVGETAPTFYYNVVGQRENASNFAQAFVQLEPGVLPQATIRSLQTELDAAFPQAQVLVRQLEQGPPFAAPIEIRLYGPNLDVLRDLGNQLRGVLAQVPDVLHTQATLAEALPKLGLQLDEARVRAAGFDRAGIARQLDATLEGTLGGSVLEDTEELPVRVRLANRDRASLDRIASVNLLPDAPSASGSNRVPLAALGNIELVPDVAAIARRDGQRVNTVQAYITAGVLPAEVLAQFESAWQASGIEFPPGYSFEWGGEAEARSSSIGNLFSTVGILGVLMVATLVLSLGSFWLAGIIGAIAISSVGLSLFALSTFGYPLGFTAILGTLGLIGLAINDSIVVISALRADPHARVGDAIAIETTIVRGTRHVITTTLTTIAGFFPLLLDRSGFWPPLAIAIAGGLGGATLLALFFVPSLYLLLVRWGWMQVEPEKSDPLLDGTPELITSGV